MNLRPLAPLLAASALGTLLWSTPASAAYHDYKVWVAVPPPLALDGVDKLAVGSLEGPMGSHLATEIRTSLMSSNRAPLRSGRRWNAEADLRVFELLERDRLNQVLAEGGETSAAGAVVLGSVDVIGPFDNWTEEVREESRKGSDGNYYKVAVKYFCLERQVKATAALRVVDARTSAILEEVTPESPSVLRDCNQDPNKVVMTAGEVMVRDAVSSLGAWFADQVAPRWMELNVFLVKDKTVRKIVVNLAKGRIEPAEALASFQGLLQSDSYNHLAIHNMGAIHEWYGDFAGAREHYERAQSIKSEGAYKKALKRVDDRMVWADTLLGLGVDVRGSAPGLSDEDLADASGPPRRMMAIKAAKAKRIPMLADADEGSQVLAQLPGGMRIEVTGEDGDYLEVVAPDGAVGWVERRYLK